MRTVREGHSNGGTYIRAWHALVALFILALVASGYVQFATRGLILGPRSWPVSLSLIAGGALALIALPALVVIPWRLIQRRLGTITDTPVVVGVIVFILCAIFLLKGATMG